MTNIYLVDYLGIHCGMHYYLEAFKQILSSIADTRIKILSNFSDDKGSKPFFINQYKGKILSKGTALIRNIGRLKRFVKRHPDDIFIYLTYGNSIDLPFMNIISKAKRHLIDIHEAIAQHVDSNSNLKKRFRKIYSGKIKNVISHSSRTDNFLKEFNFSGKTLKVPHFKYVFPKDYEMASISPELREAVDKNRINILFFGNLNENKGVDILMEAVNRLSEKEAEKINVVIAGKDFDGTVKRVTPLQNRKVKIFARHISDDELRFLYQNVDFLALPYRKTSQSGILEMAFYFKRPIIASDVEYFRHTLSKFPSFGKIAEGIASAESFNTMADAYAKSLSQIISENSGKKKAEYFKPEEYDRYEHRAEISDFVKEFSDFI